VYLVGIIKNVSADIRMQGMENFGIKTGNFIKIRVGLLGKGERGDSFNLFIYPNIF